jgi:hypothetical protein
MPRKALTRSVVAARKAAKRVPKSRGFLAHLWPLEKFTEPAVPLTSRVAAMRVTFDKSGPGMAATRLVWGAFLFFCFSFDIYMID